MHPDAHETSPAEPDRGGALEAALQVAFERRRPGPMTDSVLSRVRGLVGEVPHVRLPEAPGAADPLGRDGVPRGFQGRYEVLGEIARGGVGVVLRGRDGDLGRDVALKVLRDEHADRPEVVRRFIEEAQIAAQLQHPGIVPVYEMGLRADRRPYFSMRLIRGRTLAALLSERPDPGQDQRRFVGIFEAVCQTMAYAHARGVIHRDLKPANVMVGAYGEVQVVDWGMGKVLEVGGTGEAAPGLVPAPEPAPVRTLRTGTQGMDSRAGSVLGTPRYMPPEQAAGEVARVDERSDVFALGAMLCEILTGSPPFAMEGEVALADAAAGRTQDALDRLRASGGDADLVELAAECLAVDPLRRPRSAAVVAQRLEAYLGGLETRRRAAEIEAATSRAQAEAERRRRRLWAALALVVALLAGTVAGGLLWWQQREQERRSGAESELDAALAEAEQLAGRAQAEAEGPAWKQAGAVFDAALAVAARAQSLREGGALGTEAVERIDLTMGRLRARAAGAAAVRARRLADEALVRDLEAARSLPDGSASAPALAGAVEAALARWHAQGPREADAGRFAGQVRDAGLEAHVVPALERLLLLQTTSGDEGGRASSAALLERLDPDPWTQRVRAGLDPGTLEALAREGAATAGPPWRTEGLLARLGYVGRWAAARDLTERLRALHPDDFWVNLHCGAACQQLADLASALRWYSTAVALRPDHYQARWSLAEVLRGSGLTREAVEVAEQACSDRPDEAPARCVLALARLELGDADGARREAQRLAERWPDDVVCGNVRAHVLCQSGDHAAGLAAYASAVQRHPERAPLRIDFASNLLEAGDPEAALTQAEAAIALVPSDPRAHAVRAESLAALGRTDDAAQAREQAQQLGARQPDVLVRVAEICRRAGDLERALAILEQALELQPDSAKAWTNLAAVHNARGEHREAREAARRAVSLAPALSAAHVNLSAALLRCGDAAGAKRSAQEALRLTQGSEPAWRCWVHALLAGGEVRGALEAAGEGLASTAGSPGLSEDLRMAQRQSALVPVLDALIHDPGGPAADADLAVLASMASARGDKELAAALSRRRIEPAPGGEALEDLGRPVLEAAAYALRAAQRPDGAPAGSTQAGLGEQAWRGRALRWLQALLEGARRRVEGGTDSGRAEARQWLLWARQSVDLDVVRDPEALARLSSPERALWRRLWMSAAALEVDLALPR